MNADRSLTWLGPRLARGPSHRVNTYCLRVGFACSTRLCGMADLGRSKLRRLTLPTSTPLHISASTQIRRLPLKRAIPSGAVKSPLTFWTYWRRPSSIDQTAAGHFRGRGAFHTSELPPRLFALAVWLRRVCNEPAAIWWAAGQADLHPSVVHQIEFALDREARISSPLERLALRYLLASWATSANPDDDAFALSDAITRDGWTQPHIRRFAAISRARLQVSRPYWAGVLPPGTIKGQRVSDLIHLEVRYPERHVRFEIPDEQLVSIIPLLRQT
jgi:hypothetical protein